MNKELEEAIKVLKEIQETNRAWLKETKEERCEEIYLRDIEAIETILKELERLQEENKIMETEIAEHVYWESIPFAEIKNLYIEKDEIREKIEERKFELQQEYINFEDDIKLNILVELLEEK